MIKEKKHILIVTSEFPPMPGGIGNHAHNLSKYLSKEGFTVNVLADQRCSDLQEDLSFDVQQLYKVDRIPIKNPRFLMYFIRLVKLFNLVKSADVVLATGKFSLWSVGLLSLFKKRIYIAVVHGTEVNFKASIPKYLVNASLKRFNHVIAVSNYTKTLIEYLDLNSVKVIPNGYDSKKWKPNVTPITLTGNPNMVTLGHVSERKGQINVINILPDLIKVFPKIHYHCIGIPTESNRFKNYSKRLGVESHVTFYGKLNDEDAQSILMNSDVCVLLSGETKSGDVEGFGIALLEANALGIPSIAARGSGVEDAVKNGKSGFFVKLHDSNGFIEALNIILEKKEEFSMQAKLWTKEFDWELVIKKYIQVIDGTY